MPKATSECAYSLDIGTWLEGKGVIMDAETIIVGGGMAGMSCARRLVDAGRDALIITEELGGRVCYDPVLRNNFGAVFCMENYDNSFKIVDRNGLLDVSLGSLMLHSSPGHEFKGISATMISSVPQLLKFRSFMNKQFMPEYARYKKDCETMPAQKAFEKHPQIKRYYYMRASDLIDELGINKIADNFINKFAYACTGSKIHELNALDFLNVAQGVVVKLYNFTFDQDKYIESVKGRVVFGSVIAVAKASDGSWNVTTKDGQSFTCQNLVVATTGLTAQKLLGIDEIRQPTKLVSYLVKAQPNAEIAQAKAHYYSDEYDVIAVAERAPGEFNVFSRTEIDPSTLFTKHEVLGMRSWPEALFTYGDSILKQDWDVNCYIAGDVNGLGVEPAAISGIYAANRILGVA